MLVVRRVRGEHDEALSGFHRINIALGRAGGGLILVGETQTGIAEKGPIKPEGEEESEELKKETKGELEELKVEKIEERETEHEKAKRRKRGNNTQ